MSAFYTDEPRVRMGAPIYQHTRYDLPSSANVLTLGEQVISRSGSRTSYWEVLEYEQGFVIQRRRYALREEAVAWIESVGGTEVAS